SSKPYSLEKAAFIESVFALRQPDSEPVWAKPTVMMSLDPPSPVAPSAAGVSELDEQPLTVRATAPSIASPVRICFRILRTSSFWSGVLAGLGAGVAPLGGPCDEY